MKNHCIVISMDEIARRNKIHEDVPNIEWPRLTLRKMGKSLKKDWVPKWEIAVSKGNSVEIFHRKMLLEDVNPAKNSPSNSNLKKENERKDNQPIKEKFMSWVIVQLGNYVRNT